MRRALRVPVPRWQLKFRMKINQEPPLLRLLIAYLATQTFAVCRGERLRPSRRLLGSYSGDHYLRMSAHRELCSSYLVQSRRALWRELLRPHATQDRDIDDNGLIVSYRCTLSLVQTNKGQGGRSKAAVCRSEGRTSNTRNKMPDARAQTCVENSARLCRPDATSGHFHRRRRCLPLLLLC
jgi:hypothetical protein